MPNGAERFVGEGVRVRGPADDVVLRDLLGLTGEGGPSKVSGYSKVRLRPVGVTGVGKIDVTGTPCHGVKSVSRRLDCPGSISDGDTPVGIVVSVGYNCSTNACSCIGTTYADCLGRLPLLTDP